MSTPSSSSPRAPSQSPRFTQQTINVLFKRHVLNAQTIVVKAGSSLLTCEQSSDGINNRYLRKLAAFIHKLQAARKRVILVSSGAVAAGHAQLSAQATLSRPLPPLQQLPLSSKQVLASIGQVPLMKSFHKAFARFKLPVSQLLLSKFSINHRASYLNARNTIQALWELPAVPIVNENDPLATEELKLGDNDILGALICGLAAADLYIMLSDTAGFYLNHKHSDAELLKIVPTVTPAYVNAASGPSSNIGTGGMVTKLSAVKVNENFAIPTLLTNGNVHSLHNSIFKNFAGTLFLGGNTPTVATATQKKPSSRKRWLFSNTSIAGILNIDAGAAAALSRNKSLLPKGLLNVSGTFHTGALCNITAAESAAQPANPKVIARGLSNYSSSELKKICGVKSAQIKSRLGYKGHDEVIHKNNLVLIERQHTLNQDEQ